MSPGISERTGMDPISDPGRGATRKQQLRGPGGPFSPVGTVGASTRRVNVEGS